MPRVAVVHDWLTGLRGGERCLEVFLSLYPEADLITLLHVPGALPEHVESRVTQTSLLQRFPGSARYYRLLLPIYPLAVRSLDLREYDVVISLSHAAAKNVKVRKGAVHLSYCFTPMRYIWDRSQDYFGKATPLLAPALAALRRWDRAGAAGVDSFVAISRFVAARIRRFYGRKSVVIHPPVRTDWIRPRSVADVNEVPEGIHEGQLLGRPFLYAGALVPYKKCDLLIKVCNKAELPLLIAGSGPEEQRLKEMAGPTVTFLGRVPDGEMGELFRRTRALLFPATEDFGLIPIEYLASGGPVVASYTGALRETLPGICPWNDRDAWNDRMTSGRREQHVNGHVNREVEIGAEPGRLPGRLPGRPAGGPCGVFARPVGRAVVGGRKLLAPGDEEEAFGEAVNFFLAHEDRFSPADCIAVSQRFTVERFVDRWTAHAAGVDERARPVPIDSHNAASALPENQV